MFDITTTTPPDPFTRLSEIDAFLPFSLPVPLSGNLSI